MLCETPDELGSFTSSFSASFLASNKEKKEGAESWFEEALDFSTEEGLTGDMDNKWYRARHNEFCEMMKTRFAAEAVLIILLTGVELAILWKVGALNYDLANEDPFDHALFPGQYRVPFFIECRLIMVGLSMFWCYVGEASGLIEKHKRVVPWLILTTYCVYLWLTVVSYAVFSYSGTPQYREHADFYKNYKAPRDCTITLVFVFVFFATLRRHKFHFYQALFFVPLGLVLANMTDFSKMVLLPFADQDFKDKLMAWEPINSLPGKLLIGLQALLSLWITYNDEKENRQCWKMEQHVANTETNMQKILGTLMPPLVVTELKMRSLDAEPPSHKYRHATIAQSDLCGFTKLASTRKPTEVVTFMGELFGAFDELTDKHGVYKVETIGDAYIAGMAEEPLTQRNSPTSVVLFGLDMVRAVDKWAKGMGVSVACRVGIHYSECIGGIVGFEMQRYHLFGDLLIALEVLESTGIEGRVQVSKACKEECDREMREDSSVSHQEQMSFELRADETLLTSKGDPHSYDEVGGRTYLVLSDQSLRAI
jgi:class 3 adenylate cyclase